MTRAVSRSFKMLLTQIQQARVVFLITHVPSLLLPQLKNFDGFSLHYKIPNISKSFLHDLAPNSFPRVICHYIFSNTSSYTLFIFICSINKHPCSLPSTYICVPLFKSTHILIHLSKHSTNLTFSKDISQLKLTAEYSFSMVLVCPL